jgi:UDP-2,3-diacylglucosamine pyrophosphatase LpxH
MKWVAASQTEVVYLRGNHDDFLDEVLPLRFGNFSILLNHVHESGGKKYFVVHGDIFDSVTTSLKWVAKLGDIGYTFLLWLNRHYNAHRMKRGLSYYSLSQVVKARVKQAVSFISDYENELCAVASQEKCDGVICGHIHQADNKYIGEIHYLNSGDWVETLSAIVETENNEWKIIYYQEWVKDMESGNEAEEPNEMENEIIDMINADYGVI